MDGVVTKQLSYCPLTDASYVMALATTPPTRALPLPDAPPSIDALFGSNQDQPKRPVIVPGGRTGGSPCDLTQDYCELQEDTYVDIGLDGENNGVRISGRFLYYMHLFETIMTGHRGYAPLSRLSFSTLGPKHLSVTSK